MIAGSEKSDVTIEGMLEKPEVAQSVAEFLEKLPDINASLDVLRAFLESSTRLAENANDIVLTAREAAAKNGAGENGSSRVEDLLDAANTGTRVLSELSDPLSDPETLTNLRALLEMVPKLVTAADILDQFMSSSTRFAENLNDIVVTARKAAEKSWPDLKDRQDLLGLPGEVLKVVESPALRRLLDSRVLSDDALDVMDQVAGATIDAHREAVETDAKVGRIAAFKALGDPDVQRGVALALGFAKTLGASMRKDSGA